MIRFTPSGLIRRYEAAGSHPYRISTLRPTGDVKVLARLDSKDYSNDSDGRDYEKDSALAPGVGTFTIALHRIDDRHHLTVLKKEGKEYSRRDTSISADGKQFTFRQWGLGRRDGIPFDYTLVFDKE